MFDKGRYVILWGISTGQFVISRSLFMRWKLLVFVSLVASVVAFSVWEALIHLITGSSGRPLAPYPGLLAFSSIIPITFAAFGAVFIYRHTARRRKTQAALSILLTLVMLFAAYVVLSRLFPGVVLPEPCYGPHCA